jgi:hypothetical protein
MVADESLLARCATCGHSFSFHSKAVGAPCKAMGCKGTDGHRCTAFVLQGEQGQPVEVAANPSKG